MGWRGIFIGFLVGSRWLGKHLEVKELIQGLLHFLDNIVLSHFKFLFVIFFIALFYHFKLLFKFPYISVILPDFLLSLLLFHRNPFLIILFDLIVLPYLIKKVPYILFLLFLNRRCRLLFQYRETEIKPTLRLLSWESRQFKIERGGVRLRYLLILNNWGLDHERVLFGGCLHYRFVFKDYGIFFFFAFILSIHHYDFISVCLYLVPNPDLRMLEQLHVETLLCFWEVALEIVGEHYRITLQLLLLWLFDPFFHLQLFYLLLILLHQLFFRLNLHLQLLSQLFFPLFALGYLRQQHVLSISLASPHRFQFSLRLLP